MAVPHCPQAGAIKSGIFYPHRYPYNIPDER